MNNRGLERKMKEEAYIVSSSKGLIIILLVVSLIMLYGGGSYIYDVISKGIVGEKILYVAIWIGLFILFFGTLWNRLSFKITIERDMLKVRNMFFKEKEYYFNDITDYKFTNGRWNSNVNVFIEDKKIFSIDSSDNNFNRLYGDIRKKEKEGKPEELTPKENVREYIVEVNDKKDLKNGIISFMLFAAFIWFIMFPLGEGDSSILTFCILFSVLLFILFLFVISSEYTKIIVKGDSITLIKPPFKKNYCKITDIEKIYHLPDHIEIYMKDYTFSSKFASFSTNKTETKNIDIFLKQAEESGVRITTSDFDTYNMLK